MLELKSRGITSIIISHKLNEIGRVADQITVIRDGTTVDVIDCRDVGIDEGRVVRSMVGRELSDRYPARVAAIGGVLFEVGAGQWATRRALSATVSATSTSMCAVAKWWALPA